MSGQERRSRQRISPAAAPPVQVQRCRGGMHTAWFSQLLNLGPGGVCLRLPGELAVGELLCMTFSLPEKKNSLKLSGKIIWSQRPSPQTYEYGICFCDTDSELEDSIGLILKAYPKLPFFSF